MKYKVFLNNPTRKWVEDSDIRWLVINNAYSMPYNKHQTLLWPQVHAYMKEKYGDLYVLNKTPIPNTVIVENNFLEDPLANKTGNQTVVGGDQAIGSQAVQANP